MALYAGLRLGELQALRWGAVDLAGGRIVVRESWDPKVGAIETKTETSRRTVPIVAKLRAYLLDQKMSAETTGDRDLVFGSGEAEAFVDQNVRRRATAAWAEAGVDVFRAEHEREPTEAERQSIPPLGRLGFHQARHSFASFGIAAGINPKALSTMMGHSSIKLTFDLYGHLLPGALPEAADLLDGFLAVESEQAAETIRAAA